MSKASLILLLFLTALPARADDGATLQRRWNDFLLDKYGSTAELRKAWNCLEKPLGEEMLPDDAETRKWRVEGGRETRSRKVLARNGQSVMRLEVEKKGKVAWHPQLIAGDLAFQAGRPYTFTVRAKASKPTVLYVLPRTAHKPWTPLGPPATLRIGMTWRVHSVCFVPSESDDDARFDLTGFAPGVYEFQGASLKPGGVYGPSSECRLEDGTIPLGIRNAPSRAVEDFREFFQ